MDAPRATCLPHRFSGETAGSTTKWRSISHRCTVRSNACGQASSPRRMKAIIGGISPPSSSCRRGKRSTASLCRSTFPFGGCVSRAAAAEKRGPIPATAATAAAKRSAVIPCVSSFRHAYSTAIGLPSRSPLHTLRPLAWKSASSWAEPGTRNPEPGTWNLEPEPGTRNPEAAYAGNLIQ